MGDGDSAGEGDAVGVLISFTNWNKGERNSDYYDSRIETHLGIQIAFGLHYEYFDSLQAAFKLSLHLDITIFHTNCTVVVHPANENYVWQSPYYQRSKTR